MPELVTDTRIIAAIRTCAKNGGQGHSYDKEAVQAAEGQGLLVFKEWPSGYWKITQKGIDFLINYTGDGE